MASNVVIDISASYKDFESALDTLSAKVESTAAKMDKAFSVSGNAEKSIKNTSSAVDNLHNSLKNISIVAAGNVLADSFEKAFKTIKSVGNEIYTTTRDMQSMQMALKGLVTSDLVNTGAVADYSEAVEKAEGKTKELLNWFKELSLKSPYELIEVMDAFKMNANMGQTVDVAKKTTEAILALGAGLGMGQAEMKRFSAALAQTGSTGKITATDMRQFANNGFGMDKMNKIFDKLSEKYQIAIEDHNDFNKAVEQGKITTDDFFDAIHEFAMENYGGAVDAMASTIGGLISSMKDIKTNVINDLFLETSKTISGTLAPYIEYLMKLLTSGDFSKWGENINNWAKKALKPLQKIGDMLEDGRMSRAIKNLKDFFNGKTLNVSSIKTALKEIGGDEFADKWLKKLEDIKAIFDKFLAHKDEIIGAIQGIGTAFATAFAVNKVSGLLTAITKLNPSMVALTAIGAAFGVAWNKNLFGVQDKVKSLLEKVKEFPSKAKEFVESTKNYIGSLKNVYEEKGLSGVWDKLKIDAGNVLNEIGNYIEQHKDEWIAKAKEKPFDLIGAIFGSDAEKGAKEYVGDIESTYQSSGLVGVFEKITTDLQSLIESESAKWQSMLQGKFIDIIGFFFGDKGQQYATEVSETYKEGGLKGVFDKISTDLQALITANKADWESKLQGQFIDVVGFFFGDEGKKTAEGAVNAYNEGGLSGLFTNISNNLTTLITEKRNEWIGILEGQAINVTKIIFGEDSASAVQEYFAQLHATFEEQGASGVLQKIGEDVGKKILEGLTKIPFIADVVNYIFKIRETFSNGGVTAVAEMVGADLSKLIWKGITAIGKATNTTEFTESLKNAFDEGGIQALGAEIGEWIRTGIKSVLTNLLGKEDAEAITSGLEFLDTNLFENLSGAIDTFKTTIQNTIDKVTSIVDKDTWENAKKTFGLVAGLVAEIAIAISGMLGPAIEGVGDHIADITNFADKMFAFWGKIFDIFTDLYKGDWEKLGEDTVDLGHITERIVESIVQMAENLLMTVSDMIVSGIASIIPGGKDFLENTWKPIMGNYRERQQLRREYGIVNGNNAEGVLDYLLRNYEVGGDFANDLHWRYDILDNEDQLNYLIDYLDYLEEKGEEENQANYTYYKEALTAYKDGIYDTFIEQSKTIDDVAQAFDINEFADAYNDWWNQQDNIDGNLSDYLSEQEFTNEQLEQIVEWAKSESETMSAKGAEYYFGDITQLEEAINSAEQTIDDVEVATDELEETVAATKETYQTASDAVLDFAETTEEVVQQIKAAAGLGFGLPTMTKNSLLPSEQSSGRQRVSKANDLVDKLLLLKNGGSLLPASGVKGSVVADAGIASAPKVIGIGRRNGYMSYMYKSPEDVDTALNEFKQLDFAKIFAENPVDEDDITYFKDLLETSNNSDLTAEQRLADLQASATWYFENSANMPKEIRDLFLPILTSKNTNLYQAQAAMTTLTENMEENKGNSGGGEGSGQGEKKTTVDSTFDELIQKYNKASGSTKDVLGYQLQAMLDATYLGDDWSGNKSEGRLLLTDLMNGKYNNETYLAAKQAMANGQYSQAIYDAMSKSYSDAYVAALTEGVSSDEGYQDFVSTVLNNIVGETETTEGESGTGGLLDSLFGDPTALETSFAKLGELNASLKEDFDALIKDAESLGKYLTETLIAEFGNLKSTGVDALNSIATTARNIITDLNKLTEAIENASDAFRKFNGDGSGNTPPSGGGGGKTNGGGGNPLLMAGGGSIFPYGTAIVGEHGPEIIRNGSSRLNVFANSQLMGEIGRIRHAFNGLASSAELVSYNRLFGGGSTTANTDNSQHFENHFGAVIGDKAFRDMVDEEVRRAWRREMRLAN